MAKFTHGPARVKVTTPQTKLSDEDKAFLKELRADQAGELHVFQYPEKRITVGVRYIPGHNTARVFVALASPEETKFRKKVGEYIVRGAFDVWVSGAGYIGCPKYVPEDARFLDRIQEDLANAVARSLGVSVL